MSYVHIHPSGAVTATHRELFRRMTLFAEKSRTIMWSISGSDQETVRGKGSFHHEGNYGLRMVVKHWKGGDLCSLSAINEIDCTLRTLFLFENELGIFVSDSKHTLLHFAPDDCPVKVYIRKSGV